MNYMPTPSQREKDIIYDPWNSPVQTSILELLFDISEQEKPYMTIADIARTLSRSPGHVKKCLWQLSTQDKVFCPRRSGRWFFNTDHTQALWEAKHLQWQQMNAARANKLLRDDNGDPWNGYDPDGLYRHEGKLYTGETKHGDFEKGVKIREATWTS